MDNLIIRRVKLEDAEEISAIRKMDGVIENIMASRLETVNNIKNRIMNLNQNEVWFVAELNSLVVGMIGINKYNHYRKYTATITIMVNPDFKSNGIGSELMKEAIKFADEKLKIKRLELSVFESNINAINLYKKYGFSEEGKKIQAVYLSTGFENEIMMARISKE